MKIRVPASSANLGPGFDCFGIAWDIYNTISFSLDTAFFSVSGCEEQFCGEDNLAYIGFKKTLEYAGKPVMPVSICFEETGIPVSRGLGSSAALIAAGVTAADSLCGLKLPREILLQIATEIEGHPDNVAPALFGGFTVSVMDGETAVSAAFPISDKLHFAAIIPPFRLSTSLSRAVLPDGPSRADAVFNIGRATLLTKALAEGDTALLATALQDRLHQSYRLPLIEGWEQAEQAAEDCGAAGICLSGAGSTLLTISDRALFTPMLAKELSKCLPDWEVRRVHPDYIGAAVTG